MAQIIGSATLTPGKLDLLAAWIGRQRWYAAKGADPQLRRLFSWRLDDPDGAVGMETLLIEDDAGPEPVVYQVPLTYRQEPLAGAAAALVGTLEHSELGTRYVYDAPHDPVYAAALLELCLGRAQAQSGTRSDTPEPLVVGQPRPGGPHLATVRGSQVLSGEQSNTSMILDVVADQGTAAPIIVKVFRTLQAGANPDVVVQGALVEAGSTHVAHPVGAVAGRWPDPAGGQVPLRGHLATAAEFLAGAQDAWREALAAARADTDFTTSARALGEATAAVHSDLARAFPTVPTTREVVETTLAGMHRRLRAAVAACPELAEPRRAIAAVLEAARDAEWPDRQRIHGDYHLGQVLHSPSRGWVVLDFEGEPLRPLAERTEPDQPLRDVAGMLRSFDYVAGTVATQHPDAAATAGRWADASRRAFLDGYAERAGYDPRDQDALLAAYTMDKALYEVVYEARNRPDWLPIPRTAIDRLLTATRRHQMTPAPTTDQLLGAITALVHGRHQQPHDLLGQHVEDGGLRIRVRRPLATSVRVRFEDDETLDLAHEAEGVWSGLRADTDTTMDYRVLTVWGDGIEHEADDPYRFAPTLGEIDLHLIGEGRHEQLWTVLGSHVRSYDGPMGQVTGTSFAVWAPRARAVRVIGDFNDWDGAGHPMRLIGASGVWELFVPGVGEGTAYKFEIRGVDDVVRAKADPMARRTEVPPATASVVTRSHHQWQDGQWLEHRARNDAHSGPMSIYEVHLGSWRHGSTYADMAEHLVNYVTDLGFTHVEFLPVMEHPYAPSWGYQVTGYFAPTSRFGTPDDFKFLVDRLHQAGVGVILDWVPGHFPKDAFALGRFDGEALYEHPDPRRGDQPDWGTYIFDFGRSQVRNFLVANACYWLEEFHADGLRVDAVASMLYLDYSRNDGEWLPNERGGREHLEAIGLLQEANATAYKRSPGIVMIAEESTSWPGVTKATSAGGLGFGLKWNMGWMNDTLRYLGEQPINRQYHHNLLTFALMYAFSENYLLPISHDEVVHGKGSLVTKVPGDRGEQLASVRAYLAYLWSHPGKQLIFMGTEFAQTGEWADGRSLDWWLLDHAAHYRVHALVKHLNTIYREHDALWALDSSPAGFEWLDADDNGGNTLSYLRFADPDHRRGSVVATVINFSGESKAEVRVGVPRAGSWRVILDTSGYDEASSPSQADIVLAAVEEPWHGQPYSVTVAVAALSALYLAPEDSPAAKTQLIETTAGVLPESVIDESRRRAVDTSDDALESGRSQDPATEDAATGDRATGVADPAAPEAEETP